MRKLLPITVCLFSAAYALAAQPPSKPTITTQYPADEMPLTTISIPWLEPSSSLPGTDANPAEKINVYLRGIPIPTKTGAPCLANAEGTVFAVNLKWATHTSLAYVVLKDSRGYMHVLSINKQVLTLFPKSFLFPAADYMFVNSIKGNRLKMFSKNDAGHYYCDFEVEVQASGVLRLIRYETERF